MGKQYQQVTFEERCEISRLRASGLSVRQIAASLDRAPSTVSRELNRNGSRTQGYRPSYAQQQVWSRRWRGARLERDDALSGQFLSRLKQGWSPEQVAGRLALEAGVKVISHRASTASSTGRWLARKTTPSATTCPAPSPNGAGEVVEAAVRRRSFSCAGPWPSVPRMGRIASRRDIGRWT